MLGKLSKNGAIFVTLLLAGCAGDDAEGLAHIARLSADKLEKLTGGAPHKAAASFDSMRANWNELALDARVSLRLRWEKELQGATIHVEAGSGIVELKGKVRDFQQRQRAVQVAQSTTGTVEVIDSLEVSERH
jgi:osmotically-inducible protein OsmY